MSSISSLNESPFRKILLISIDAGTTSNRAILFDLKGKPIFSSQKEFTQYFPKSGWVEHNPEEIWNTTKKSLKDVILKAKKLRGKVLAIGITNQRETTVLWDKKTGKTVYKAIVWQDRRQAEYCKKLKKQNKSSVFSSKIFHYGTCKMFIYVLNRNLPSMK